MFFFLHCSLWWWNPFWFLSSSYFSFFFNYLFYLVKFRLLLQSFLNFTHAWSADSEIDTFTDLVKQGAEEETIANIVESLLCFIKLLSNEISASKLGIKKHWKVKKKKNAHFTFFPWPCYLSKAWCCLTYRRVMQSLFFSFCSEDY